MKKMKGYADGGIVEDDEEQIDPLTPPAEPDYNKELSNYFGQQKTAVDKFGPDQQKAVVDHVLESQGSIGNNVARGGAAFADALMQGVAGAGNPGYLQGIDARQKGQLENAEEEGKSLNEQNLQGIKEKTSLDAMSSGNPLGASRANAMRPLLKQIYPTLQDQELDSILGNPSAAEAALGPAVNLKEAEAKIGATAEDRAFRHQMQNQNFNEGQIKHQDELEKNYQDTFKKILSSRSGGLGLQDAKVNQAIHLRQMINAAHDPKTGQYNLPEMQMGELAMGLASLVSNGNVASVEQLKSVTPKSFQGDAAHMAAYWSGTPLNAQPQALVQNLIHAIDRQGQTSQQLRDTYLNQMRKQAPGGLDQERAKKVESQELGNNYDDYRNPGGMPSATPDGRVTVISPSGQIGHIPASQLKAALDKGYKQQ